MRLVLASASPARRRALEDAGVRPIVQVSDVDEDEVTTRLGPLPASQLALALARAKALDVASGFASRADTVVVGCDSLFELDDVAYGKPLDAATAVRRIRQMSGRSGLLHTGHWVVHGPDQVGRTTTTRIDFAPMRDDEIEAYVATGEPLNVAGSFTLDGLGAAFVAGISGDPSNVVGISLPTLRLLLGDLGISWPLMWATP